MSKQCLDVQQMQHLQELGMDLKETMLYWVVYEAGHENNFVTTKENAMEVIEESCGMLPAYTLQDVLEALPESILKNDIQYWLSICRATISIWMISYSDDVDLTTNLHHEEYESLIDAAYSMLCWAIEQGYVETNKNE